MNPSSLFTPDPIDRHRFPPDAWGLRETRYDASDLGRTETLFAVANGYLGMRGNVEEGRDSFAHGTFINGFHETWPIRHAEEAYGFARVGQTIVNVPDSKIIRLYVDDEPLLLTVADLHQYERTLDFRDGVLRRDLIWQTPSGKTVRVRSRRMVSFTERHLAVMTYEVTLLDADAPIVLSSQMLNRQDGQDEYHVRAAAMGEGFDPRKAETLKNRVLVPSLHWAAGGRYVLGYRVADSGMTLAVAADHTIETENSFEERTLVEEDLAKHVYRIDAKQGKSITITKVVAYHSSRGVPAKELVDRCRRTLDRVAGEGVEYQFTEQRQWLDAFWARSDVEVPGQPELQQAIRWNLFQIAQATARAEGNGIPAKGLTGSGYSGHYFWDTEIYVLPFLTYTSPRIARNALRFRYTMLDSARERAAELNQNGALFPWRTINGEEASAYYAAGTAQYHIDADIAHAVKQYVAATGDLGFLAREAVDILVETARMWADLGFWRGQNGDATFHIHGVTGPDEYTTVVNDNLFTNVMARANLRGAVDAVDRLAQEDPGAHAALLERLRLTQDELDEFARAAERMAIPFDERLGIHPQDAQFLEKELWDLANTDPSKRPLLLYYHPLVIYRFQVLKQADVVLALFLQGDQFTAEEKLADFDYYDPLTTGDSTLSAVVQSIIASEVGYQELALRYFTSAAYVDLADLHHNTSDGVHVASLGGVWSALACGFGGMRDHEGVISLDPRLPEVWDGLTFRIALHGTRVRVDVRHTELRLTVEDGDQASLLVRGESVTVRSGDPVTVPLAPAPRLIGTPTVRDIEGSRRADGTVITASVPDHPALGVPPTGA
ncbi:glycoside hydrolase family 65 protein [Cellulomonas denverensis]|uniref:Glycoside hydrolase family 65 protein n=1 Tax=Cellulomonas denverensis TaxID=264297 RepID=A0A7X6QXG8_9CELL|nr:glycoside hydrolase family 65 protein [Cellulomonas denverensis]NKY21068.1 glycoside hydrolase family 65 protein [Cellulomonas denverensis]GIG26015.1 kojibiose phosphorylase [Cellulomonas denverensis]